MRRIGRTLGRALGACGIAWLLTYGAVITWTYLWPMDRPMPQGDVIVCLSGGGDIPQVMPNGVRSRAEACVELFDAGAAPSVLFTGGALNTNLPSSAVNMAAATDLPEAAILIEPNARSTLQNALYSLSMIEGDDRLILVTEAYHLPRAWMSFRLMGARDVALYASTRIVARSGGSFMERHPILRESLAIWFNVGRVAAYHAGGFLGIPDENRAVWLF